MKQKINLRLGLIALVAMIAATMAVTLAYYSIFQTQVRSDLKTNAQLLADTGFFQNLYAKAEESAGKIDREALTELTGENLRITWIAPDGTVLYDNDTEASVMGNHLDRPEITQALENGCGESIRRSDTLQMNTFYYALRLSDGTVLRISTQARSITSVFLSSLPLLVLVLVIILSLCILLSHLLTLQLIRPINTMAEHMDDATAPPIYRELEPFAYKIRSQHEKILGAAKSRQDFTANISHELKTPLTAISGYAELLENSMVEPEQVPSVAQGIHQNANRLLSLINDIIRLSELDHREISHRFEHVNLYKLAEDCCRSLRVTAEQRDITLSCVGADTVLMGERELLKELLENLIQNAIRYNRPQGWVRVKVTTVENHAVLTVADSGIGIAPEHQDRVFERFYRVDKSRSRETGGTGLGLAIVKHIAELHGAEIKLESELSQGTKITVTF